MSECTNCKYFDVCGDEERYMPCDGKANICPSYDEDYIPSATMGDYSPSNPWDAPGLSISDFI